MRVERLQAKLGPPALSRDFSQQKLGYEWKPGNSTTIGVSEFIGNADWIFVVQVSRD